MMRDLLGGLFPAVLVARSDAGGLPGGQAPATICIPPRRRTQRAWARPHPLLGHSTRSVPSDHLGRNLRTG
jgi:hypothetical protein